MKPTSEQLAALELFRSGDSMVVDAGAGTGKTSTLRLLAYATQRRGHYLAYNRSIADDVGRRLPDRCSASTVHSFAMRQVGQAYRHRINGPRMASREIAQRLKIERVTVPVPGKAKVLEDGFLGSLAMKAIARFCQTADELPDASHVPWIEGIDWPDAQGQKIGKNNDMVARMLEPALRKAWADLMSPTGQLPFKHEHYLKLWALSGPRLEFDYIMLDEAQDANPVIAQVLDAQDHAQRVLVGDGAQAIYEFTGAVNAMESFELDHRRQLTQSFRFGPAIADRANLLLGKLGAPLRLSGLPSIDSQVGYTGTEVDAILTRTNARAVREVLDAMRQGRVPFLVGGGVEVVRFARAAEQLATEHWTAHPDLACFTSWEEVVAYVEEDPQGSELKLMVEIVEEFGVATIVEALATMANEADADVTVTTAHKSKGREWPRVRIADDFAGMQPTLGEMRLQYVAVTRAERAVDDHALAKMPAPDIASVVNDAQQAAGGAPSGSTTDVAPSDSMVPARRERT